MSLVSDVEKKLIDLQEINTIAVRLKAEHYLDTIRAIIDNFASKNDLNSIYITFTIPSQSLMKALEALEVNLSRICFIDGISNVMMSATMQTEKTLFIESTTMLEYLMLKIEFLLRKNRETKSLVVLDSINSLAIHNNSKILSEFLHILSNHLRTKDTRLYVLSMEEYETDEVRSILNLVCEESLKIGEVVK